MTLDTRPLRQVLRDNLRIEIHPDLAARILKECWYEGQDHRKISAQHVRVLAADMRSGCWTGGMQIHIAEIDGRYFLVDGYHRLNALIEAARAIEFSVIVTPCATIEEVKRLYWRHDFNQRPRPMVLAAVVDGAVDRNNLAKAQVASVMAAVLMIAARFAAPVSHAPVVGKSPDARLAAAKPWWKFGQEYFRHVGPAQRPLKDRLQRAALVSVGMLTLRYQPEKAAEFWSGVAADDGLRQGDPRKTLIHHITVNVIGDGARQADQPFVAAAAWNAWFEGRALKVIKLQSGGSPIILGTPFDKRKRADVSI